MVCCGTILQNKEIISAATTTSPPIWQPTSCFWVFQIIITYPKCELIHAHREPTQQEAGLPSEKDSMQAEFLLSWETESWPTPWQSCPGLSHIGTYPNTSGMGPSHGYNYLEGCDIPSFNWSQAVIHGLDEFLYFPKYHTLKYNFGNEYQPGSAACLLLQLAELSTLIKNIQTTTSHSWNIWVTQFSW